MKLSLDESVPVGVRDSLAGHCVATVPEMGWAGLGNRALLMGAEQGGFDVVITGDQNMVYQRNLSDRRIALVVMSTNHWLTIKTPLHLVRAAVSGAGAYVEVSFPRRQPPRDRS
jgi:hypothetical protein